MLQWLYMFAAIHVSCSLEILAIWLIFIIGSYICVLWVCTNSSFIYRLSQGYVSRYYLTICGSCLSTCLWCLLRSKSERESCSVMSDSLRPHGLIQSMEFPRPEYWSGQPFPSPGDLPYPGIEPGSPTLQVDSLTRSHQGSPTLNHNNLQNRKPKRTCTTSDKNTS